MITDRIEQETFIAASAETVWAVLTEPAHIAGWFSDAVEIDLRPGGDGLLTWTGHPSARLRVERVDPPHTLAFRWVRRTGWAPDAGNATRVEFTLTAEGAGTRLRVVESGFPQLDWPEDEVTQYVDENTHGWGRELDELRTYVSALDR